MLLWLMILYPVFVLFIFFFKQKTAYEMRISDWSSDVCSSDLGTVTVPETHVAIDCGFVANPERVQSQIQGACVYGMTAAMYSGITLENGAVVESNFHDYEMVRDRKSVV